MLNIKTGDNMNSFNIDGESLITMGNDNWNITTDSDPVTDSEWYSNNDFDFTEERDILHTSDNTFCFETDHAALVGNSDYLQLTKALAILQVQRVKAIEDINRLDKLRSIVRSNPKAYLKKFLKGDTSDIPDEIIVQQVPVIDWSKYALKNNSEHFSNNSSNRKLKKIDISEHQEVTNNDCPKYELKHDDGESDKSSNIKQSRVDVTEGKSPKQDASDTDTAASRVRGRTFDQSKPQTFNQLWTPEEQLRLEELLLEFPPERNENSRWRKIAQALGNRTTKQVCSRVQKYFKKLNRAGLPIPGHQLKTNTLICLKKKQRRVKKVNTRDSTFFPTQHLGAPKLLDGCEEENKKLGSRLSQELKTNLIKKVIEFKKKDDERAPYCHPNIKCAVCGESPLRGTRWRCLACPNISLCGDCVVSQLWAPRALHPPRHPLEPLTDPALAHLDPDYAPDTFNSSNYLDPNVVSSNLL